jgi:predicted metalloendopeptidase
LVQEVDEMVNTMKAAFKENLPRLEWMSNGSLAAAETKLDQMVDLIGYPEFVMNSSWVDSIYADLSITEGNPTGIILSRK